MAKNTTPFQAASHGFEFVNRFELNLPVKFQLPLVGEINLNNVVFGLCGGMCYAALDYFYAHKDRPLYATVPEIERPLLSYLIERQLDSLTIPTLIKIIEWMSQGDQVLAARVVKSELPRLRKTLDKGAPAVLCLIRASEGGDPTHNHQVVATGYDLDSVPGSMVITLYDPNHPGLAPTITASLSLSNFQLKQSSGEALRGFFLMPYAARKLALPVQKPPAVPQFDFGAPVFDDETGLGAAAGAPVQDLVPELPFRLCWPVDSRIVTQRFGENPRTYRPFGLAGHEGIDFYAPTGSRIYAAFAGTVSEAKYRGAYGNQVRIRHEHNGAKFITVYAHMQKILAAVGQQVSAGDLIGLADNTGNSRGSHLHFTLFLEGAKTPGYYDMIVDPWQYFEGNDPPPPPELSGIEVYTLRDVNLRELPSDTATILTLLPAGELLPVFGKAEEVKKKIGQKLQWLQVKTAGGQTGFVAAWFVADHALQAFPPSGLVVYPFDVLALRTGPGLGLAPRVNVNSQTPLNVLGNPDTARTKVGQKDQWLQVLAPDGSSGFVPGWLVRVTGENPPATDLLVTPSTLLNLRAAPNKAADVMAVVAPGDVFKVVGDTAQARGKIGKQEQWLNVQAPNGVIGWVAAWLVNPTSAPAVTPGGQPAPQPAVAGALVAFPVPDEGINLRGTPDAGAMRVDGALKNEPLTILDADPAGARSKIGQQEQWLYVQKTNGKRGWAAAWFLSPAKI
jgi:murein DD-endopeptidase MepM/ murein hydrolase activator NlpD/SH3-like domain-containing protein